MSLGEVTWSPVSSSKVLGIHSNHVGNNKNTVSNCFISEMYLTYVKPGDLHGFRKPQTESWNREERKSSIVYRAFNNKNKSQFRTEWSAIQSTIKNFVNNSCVRWYSNSHVLG